MIRPWRREGSAAAERWQQTVRCDSGDIWRHAATNQAVLEALTALDTAESATRIGHNQPPLKRWEPSGDVWYRLGRFHPPLTGTTTYPTVIPA